jgi:hypothetical protein
MTQKHLAKALVLFTTLQIAAIGCGGGGSGGGASTSSQSATGLPNVVGATSLSIH